MLTFEKLSRDPEIIHRPTSVDIDLFNEITEKAVENQKKAQSD